MVYRRISYEIRSKLLAVLSCLLFAGLTSCIDTQTAKNPIRSEHEFHHPMEVLYSEEDFKVILTEFSVFFEATIKQAALKIEQQNTSPAVNRSILLWKITMIPANKSIIKQKNAVTILLDYWILSMRMNEYFETGSGKDHFGQYQPLVIKASQRITARIDQISKEYLPELCYQQGSVSIAGYAHDNPLIGLYSEPILHAPLSKDGIKTAFKDSYNIPLNIFAVSDKLDQGIEAVHRFSDVGDRFVDQMGQFPEIVRWEIGLLINDMENTEFIKKMGEKIQDYTENSKKLSLIMDNMPSQFRNESLLIAADINDKMTGQILAIKDAMSEFVNILTWRIIQIISILFVLLFSYHYFMRRNIKK